MILGSESAIAGILWRVGGVAVAVKGAGGTASEQLLCATQVVRQLYTRRADATGASSAQGVRVPGRTHAHRGRANPDSPDCPTPHRPHPPRTK